MLPRISLVRRSCDARVFYDHLILTIVKYEHACLSYTLIMLAERTAA